MTNYQIIIVGCGPVGLTLANCLVRSPLIRSIALIDRHLPPSIRNLPQLPNQRVFSINYPSLKLYRHLNVLENIRKEGIMNRIQVISKQSEEFVNWDQNEVKIIENDQLVSSLMKNLTQNGKGKVQFIQDEIQHFQDGNNCKIKLKSQREISASLLVGSDGNKSKVKEIAKIHTYGWTYRQRAIACTMKLKENSTIGNQIYHEGNTLAVLPLWDNYASLVWSLGIPQFEHMMTLSEEDFKQKLNNVIKNSNKKFAQTSQYENIQCIEEICNKRLSFPLSNLQSANYTANRIALIGDAAHTIHPMAGLGVNAGIADSVFLANNIIKNIKTGNDFGQLMALSHFQAQSKSFNYTNSIALESIKNGFSGDYPLINIARKTGMKILNSSQNIKSWMKSLVEQSPALVNYEWQS